MSLDPQSGHNGGTPTPQIFHQSLAQAVFARRQDYVRTQKIKIKIASWNVAASPGTDKDIGDWLVYGKGISESLAGLKADNNNTTQSGNLEDVDAQEARVTSGQPTAPLNDPGTVVGGTDIGLYVIGLQEVVDVGSATEAFKPYNDPGPSLRWKAAVQTSLPEGYKLIAEQQLHGLLMMIYASPDVALTVSSVSCSAVGTGLLGYMGNKGAVTTRIVLGETTRLVFVNSHLAAGNEKMNLDRRNWDAGQVVSRTKYDPVDEHVGVGEKVNETIGDEDFAWWFGDLNYRLEGIPGDDVRRLLLLHTRNEYDIGQRPEIKIEEELERTGSLKRLEDKALKSQNSSFQTGSTNVNQPASMTTTLDRHSNQLLDPCLDPASLQTTLSSLLPHDQLRIQQLEGKCFHDGWREGMISFLPTYKYDVGSVGLFDTSEKRRAPSWCDRILYRSRRDKERYEQKVKDTYAAKQKDNEMTALGVDRASEDEEILFDYDPETDGVDEAEDYPPDKDGMNTKTMEDINELDDQLTLDAYISHQRIVSSDHKPLVAVFTLNYNATIPALKSVIHQEVAKELDRIENETRAGVTIVVENDDKQNDVPEQVRFGDVRYNVPLKQSFTIANTSQVPATFSFVDNLSPPDHLPISWLSMDFDFAYQLGSKTVDGCKQISLEPGDAINVQLTALVSKIEDVRALNRKKVMLDEILVLRLINGRDHFIPVHGDWLQSAFGRSVEELVCIPEGGVRRLSMEVKEPAPTTEVKWSAPREIFRLTGAIEDLTARAAAEWDMTKATEPPWNSNHTWPFQAPLQPVDNTITGTEHLQNVREAIDTDQPLLSMLPKAMSTLERLETISNTLFLFLGTLDRGIIDSELWAQLEPIFLKQEKRQSTPGQMGDERTPILDRLSHFPSRNISFLFLTGMLVKIIGEISAVALTEKAALPEERRKALVKLFAPLIVQSAKQGEKEKERRSREVRLNQFVLIFTRIDGS
ncbi:MAG: hypothetical protein M1814_003467 [Vezdaea aestivalis]|nr:MAG: hypothetical protein M1814_003467 [Vezdaea aestivalis]